MSDDRPEETGSLPDSERPKRAPPTIDLEATEPFLNEIAELPKIKRGKVAVGIVATRSSIIPFDHLKRIFPSCGFRRSEMSSFDMIFRRCTSALRCAPGTSMKFTQSPSMRSRTPHGAFEPFGST
jgi:hypothetical protein